MQALNVVCGGTLQRHINDHVQDDNKYWRHDTPQTMYTSLKDRHGNYRLPLLSINSLHHQCVNRVAPGFEVIGWSEYAPGDPAKKKAEFKGERFTFEKSGKMTVQAARPMVPEIMRHETLPYIAFQYHPEEFNCTLAISLIEETISKYDTQKEEVASAEKTTA